jgi:hypothetical protein
MPAIASAGQRITDCDPALGLTAPGSAQKALVFCHGTTLGTGGVRWYDDGRTPDATSGMILFPGSYLVVDKEELATILFFDLDANAVLEVTYYSDRNDMTGPS